MLEARFNLDISDGRPRFKLKISDAKIDVLLDTGAVYPVWTSSEKILTEIFGLTVYKEKIPISGFGGTDYGNSYHLPLLILGDFIYSDLFLVCDELKNAPCDLILPATMFKNLCVTINFLEKTLQICADSNDNQSHRNPEVINSNGISYYLYHHLYEKGELEKELLDDIRDNKTPSETARWYYEYSKNRWYR